MPFSVWALSVSVFFSGGHTQAPGASRTAPLAGSLEDRKAWQECLTQSSTVCRFKVRPRGSYSLGVFGGCFL